ncbi:MAG: mechanosensitive ion channel family protein, partial [Bacteroidetes bacterium]
MEQVRVFYRSVMDFLQYPVFPLGKEYVTLASLLYLVISLILLFYLSAKLR